MIPPDKDEKKKIISKSPGYRRIGEMLVGLFRIRTRIQEEDKIM